MQGQINSAVRNLSADDCGGVLPPTDDIMRQLHEKHPYSLNAIISQRSSRGKTAQEDKHSLENLPDQIWTNLEVKLYQWIDEKLPRLVGMTKLPMSQRKRILYFSSSDVPRKVF